MDGLRQRTSSSLLAEGIPAKFKSLIALVLLKKLSARADKIG